MFKFAPTSCSRRCRFHRTPGRGTASWRPSHRIDSICRWRSFSSQTGEARSQGDGPSTSTTGGTDESWTLLRGPQLTFQVGGIASLTESAVIGSSGRTVALATVAAAFSDPGVVVVTAAAQHGRGAAATVVGASDSSINNNNNKGDISVAAVARHLKRRCRRDASSTMLPLTVDYRQRHHAVGKIPTAAHRSDNRRPTDAETLASRAIDRALRPLLRGGLPGGTARKGTGRDANGDGDVAAALHLSCSIQACPVAAGGASGGGHPVALALNSASVALRRRLRDPVAAVSLCLLEDGTVLVDSCTTASVLAVGVEGENQRPAKVAGELLYAGTRDSVVMMEFSGMLTEPQLVELIQVAHDCIQPLLDIQQATEDSADVGDDQESVDAALRAELGLDSVVLGPDEKVGSSFCDSEGGDQALSMADQIYDEARGHVKSELKDVALRLFGVQPERACDPSARTVGTNAAIHSEDALGPLLRKGVRGRREHLVREEIKRLLVRFRPADLDLSDKYQALLKQDPSIVNVLADVIHSGMLRDAMQESAIKYRCRADGRGGRQGDGCTTIRPLSIEVPALPDVVHGSALFTRGETQVLCTATLGPPKDGILRTDPYSPPTASPSSGEGASHSAYQDLPVGSLRYLKTQEYLQSDLNSRKIRADREQTGDSGTLNERRRAFLQYDFPAFSKGEVQTGSASASRREIGHGALAEKAILPILPPASEFPYAIRMTSEVTSSNGSSSMASVCGVTLALLDAGVPISSPAAGVSVGLVVEGSSGTHQLLLDLTGTEDHYGGMDFKVAGTASHVTAFQLDVKQPLALTVIVDALSLAKEGRIEVLREMAVQSAISSKGVISDLTPRPELKDSAPRVEVVKFDPVRKRDLLGPGGVVIRQMEDRFNVSLDLTQEGQCLLFGDDREMVRKARAAVMDLVSDVEVGLAYEGTVIELRDFGVIIELLRNKEGLCHVSELASKDEIRNHPNGTLGLVNEKLRVGQKIGVVCTAVDPVQGTIRLRLASTKETFSGTSSNGGRHPP